MSNLSAFLKKRKNRYVGRILHEYDNKNPDFKEIFKAETNRLFNEIYDLLESVGLQDKFNLLAEEVLKETEKEAYGAKTKR